VPADVASDLTAARRVADVHGVVQIEMIGHCRQVVRVVIHVVTVTGLRGAAAPTAVVGDHPVTVEQKEQHLGVPVVS
jgi:hypothetical protein